MLFVVLLLVLAALGLLVPALTSTQTHWAWLSVGASGAAAVVLVLDWWLRRRSSTSAGGAAGAGRGEAGQQGNSVDLPDVSSGAGDGPGSVERPSGGDRAADEADVEPGEEDTDAADSLVVSDLTDEVRVLDERPRYHLADCTWLGARASLGLPVDEARRLGFTPCTVCRPDAGLAARKRAADRSEPA